MTLTAPAHRRPHIAARKFGYLIGITVNAVFLYLINIRPGWEVLPFLTADTPQILGLMNLSLVVGIVVNAAYVTYDPLWFKALGDFVTAAIGLAVLVRIWRVFPFDFSKGTFSWVLPVRAVLAVAIAGTVIAIFINFVLLLRHASVPSRKLVS